MPKKVWSEQERKAWGEKMKALRDAKQGPQLKVPNVPRPVFVTLFQWNQHLKDHGFEVME